MAAVAPTRPEDVGDSELEDAMEQMLLAQDEEDEVHGENFLGQDPLDLADGEDAQDFDDGDGENDIDDEDMHDDMAFLDGDNNNDMNFEDSAEKSNPFTYVSASFWAAAILVYYAFRSRQQWYLALVFLSSSKYAYVILGNAFVAFLIWCFQATTGFFLNGLRLNEAEGLGDFFRWHITETCLALTIFRSELTVKTFVLFLFLVFSKCLHHIVDAREAHLRMTEEIVVANPTNGWMSIRYDHVKLFALMCILQVLDIVTVVLCGQDIMKNGPSVAILFAFESAIMLTSVISNTLLWYLHLLDGILHCVHENSDATSLMHKWIYPWKDHKATLIFAVELQAQAAKFLFYLTFFAIVFTYYGLPINLIREVYYSFDKLKGRVAAFNKYRQLMASMNRFKNPTEEELEEEHICIICRDEMTVETAKKLPGCGHIFHKSCLREWLVQQQTCPTCRGDIAAMEARQKRQDAINERIQEEQQEEEEDDQQQEEEEATHQDEAEGETTVEDQPSAQKSGDGNPTEESTAKAKPTKAPEVEHRKSPPRTNDYLGLDQQLVIGKPDSPRKIPILPPFPAFFRVVRGTGAEVYRDEGEEEQTAFLVTRVVPYGMVFLATTMEWRMCVLENKMMVKMPDGWVDEVAVQRIDTVRFQSSPTR